MVKVEYILFDTLQWENVEGVIYADNLDKALVGLKFSIFDRTSVISSLFFMSIS